MCLMVFKRMENNWLIVVEEAACDFLILPLSLCVIARAREFFSFMVVEMRIMEIISCLPCSLFKNI